MSIKKKIQQSMTVILTVTLVLAYVILSAVSYTHLDVYKRQLLGWKGDAMYSSHWILILSGTTLSK